MSAKATSGLVRHSIYTYTPVRIPVLVACFGAGSHHRCTHGPRHPLPLPRDQFIVKRCVNNEFVARQEANMLEVPELDIGHTCRDPPLKIIVDKKMLDTRISIEDNIRWLGAYIPI